MQELTEKYRPRTFEEVMGQESAIESLTSIFNRREGLPHAFLFTGPRGCGKTTLAMILKEKLRCGDRDYNYYNTSNTRGIDSIREIDSLSKYKPIQGPVKFYLLDECHKLTNEAQNAMLALLERPPAHAYFALCTTDPDKLLKTVRSRCVTYQVKPLSRMQILKLLKRIVEAEGLEISKKVLTGIAKNSNGSARDSIKSLDQVMNISGEEAQLRALSEGIPDDVDVFELFKVLVDRKMGAKTKWADAAAILRRNRDSEPEQIRQLLKTALTTALLNDGSVNVAAMLETLCEPLHFNAGFAGLTYQVYMCCRIGEE